MRTLPDGAWHSISDVPEQQKHAVIQVGPYFYNAGVFHLQARAAYAKAIVFAAEARIAFHRRELIWAAIAAYYSLFHFSLFLVFVLPEEIEPETFLKLIDKRRGGTSDPTEIIVHNYVPRFLGRCQSKGLTSEMRATVERARLLRNFVNYGPRSEWADGEAIFRSMKHKPKELEEVIRKIVPLWSEVLDWARKTCNPARPYSDIARFMFQEFITKPDLFYVEWCSPEVLEEASTIAQGL